LAKSDTQDRTFKNPFLRPPERKQPPNDTEVPPPSLPRPEATETSHNDIPLENAILQEQQRRENHKNNATGGVTERNKPIRKAKEGRKRSVFDEDFDLIVTRDKKTEPKNELLATTSTGNTDELLETSLSQTFEQENSIKTVSKELFNTNGIELKSEVDHDEINNITRLHFLKEKFGISNVDTLVSSFLRLRVSKDRKSRREFIEALQTENRNSNPGGSLMARMFGGGGSTP